MNDSKSELYPAIVGLILLDAVCLQIFTAGELTHENSFFEYKPSDTERTLFGIAALVASGALGIGAITLRNSRKQSGL